MIVSIQLLSTLSVMPMFLNLIFSKNINKNNIKCYSQNISVSLKSAAGHRMKIYGTASVNVNIAKPLNVTVMFLTIKLY